MDCVVLLDDQLADFRDVTARCSRDVACAVARSVEQNLDMVMQATLRVYHTELLKRNMLLSAAGNQRPWQLQQYLSEIDTKMAHLAKYLRALEGIKADLRSQQ